MSGPPGPPRIRTGSVAAVPFGADTIDPGTAGSGMAGTPRSVAVVGNAPGLPAGAAARIDAADWVIRFNNCAGFGAAAGRRVTHLALVNCGGQAREWVADAGFARRPAVHAAREFLLTVHPGPRPAGPPCDAERRADPDRADWTGELAGALWPLGRPVRLLPRGAERRCAEAVALAAGRAAQAGTRLPPPSSGTLVIHHLLRWLAPLGIVPDCWGFGFAGWSGHDWGAERRWAEAAALAGRLRLHPPPSAGTAHAPAMPDRVAAAPPAL